MLRIPADRGAPFVQDIEQRILSPSLVKCEVPIATACVVSTASVGCRL